MKLRNGNCKLKVFWLRKIVRDLQMKFSMGMPNFLSF
jgi:hypothetical protein